MKTTWHGLKPDRVFRRGVTGKGIGPAVFLPDRSKYRAHYNGKRGIAAARNRAKIKSGKIPRDQVLRYDPTGGT